MMKSAEIYVFRKKEQKNTGTSGFRDASTPSASRPESPMSSVMTGESQFFANAGPFVGYTGCS